MKWFLVAIIALAQLLVASVAHADDPRLDYHTIETPHFWVHYHDGTEALAHKVATACEEAHIILSPLLDWTPRGKTHVLVDDRVDSANGFASSYGRRQITVFGMPPEADSVLGFYDDWIRVLVFHEYVHILHLDTALGVPPLINKLIGRQWLPNQTLPRWYVEGLATYYESATTRGGRVKGALFQMYLRVAALSGEFFDLGGISGPPSDYPTGTVAYLYGGFFLDYVFAKHGAGMGADFNRRYGRRIVPWALNSISRDLSGQSFDELYDEWTAVEQGKAVGTLVAVRARGETKLRPVTKRGGATGWPRLRPNTQEIWFYDSDAETAPHYSSILTTGKSRERRFEVEGGAGPFDFTPDGRHVLYTQQIDYQTTYRYTDLYAFDLKNQTAHRLTHGDRAREPAVSPSGDRVAYVRNRAGTMELVVRPYPNVSRGESVLVSGLDEAADTPGRWQQISTPEWSPDGEQIAISWWTQADGHRDIWLVDADGDGEPVRLTNDFSVDVDPHWAPDGWLYFASDRSGVYNIYRIDPRGAGTVEQMSDVVNGVFAPQLAPDGKTMFVRSFGPEGYDLASFELPAEPSPAPAPVAEALEPVEYPDVSTERFQTKNYNSLRWMQPLLLQPQLGVLTSGAGAGASVVGYDPIGHHSYELTAGYTTGPELADRGASAALAYGYRGLPVTVGLSGLVRDAPRTRSLFVESDYQPFLERQWVARATLRYPLRALTDTLTFSVAYEVDYTQTRKLPSIEHDPADLEPSYPRQGFFNELDFGLSYSNREAFPQSISTSKGWSTGISLDVQDPALGADYQRLTFSYGFDAFIPNPLWTRHVFALFLDGAISTSDTGSPRSYSLGGNRPQDILTSIVFQQQRGSFVVRGFPPGATDGTQYQRGVLEYRFPVLQLDEGLSTVPVFLRQIKGALFVDSGVAFNGFLADAEYLTGVGGEIILQSVFAYYLFGNLRLGYARGLGAVGTNEFYLLFGGGF